MKDTSCSSHSRVATTSSGHHHSSKGRSGSGSSSSGKHVPAVTAAVLSGGGGAGSGGDSEEEDWDLGIGKLVIDLDVDSESSGSSGGANPRGKSMPATNSKHSGSGSLGESPHKASSKSGDGSHTLTPSVSDKSLKVKIKRSGSHKTSTAASTSTPPGASPWKTPDAHFKADSKGVGGSSNADNPSSSAATTIATSQATFSEFKQKYAAMHGEKDHKGSSGKSGRNSSKKDRGSKMDKSRGLSTAGGNEPASQSLGAGSSQGGLPGPQSHPTPSSSLPNPSHSTASASATLASIGSGGAGGNSLSPMGDTDSSKPATPAAATPTVKTETPLVDPYEFNAKVEDRIGVPMKKIKLEKTEPGSSGSVVVGVPTAPPPPPAVRDSAVETSNMAVITDPDCLGPCEPGTSVVLEGIVWNETDNGLLVVNVTWRGKTYVGTLMDATKHDWAPPRFNSDSLSGEYDGRTPKGRGKRGRNTPAAATRYENNGSDRRLRSNRRNNSGASATISAPPLPQCDNTGSKRKTRAGESNEGNNPEGPKASKRTRSDSKASDGGDVSGLIECPEPNCNKKYRHPNGLKYHQTHAHKASIQSEDSNDCTSKDSSASSADGPTTNGATTTSAKASRKREAPTDTDGTKPAVEKDSKENSKENSKEKREKKDKRNHVTPSDSSKNIASESGKSSSPTSKSTSSAAASKKEKSPSRALTQDGKKSSKQPTVALTPVSVTKVTGSSTSSVLFQVGTASQLTTVGGTMSMVGATGTTLVTISGGNIVQATPATVAVPAVNASIPVSVSSVGIPPVPSTSKDAEKHSKKSKSEKNEKSHKSKPGGSANTAVSAARPIMPAPTATQVPAVTTTTTSGVSQANGSTSTVVTTTQLKPIQPKPTVLGEQAAVNPTLAASLREMKEKKPKKKKNKDKDRDREKNREGKNKDKHSSQKSKQQTTTPKSDAASVIKSAPTTAASTSMPAPPAIIRPSDKRKDSTGPPQLEKQDTGKATSTGNSDSNALHPPNASGDSNAHSPAYSDISDANESAPTLEKVTQPTQEPVRSEHTPSVQNQDSQGVSSPYYGQPPFLTPAVPPSTSTQDAVTTEAKPVAVTTIKAMDLKLENPRTLVSSSQHQLPLPHHHIPPPVPLLAEPQHRELDLSAKTGQGSKESTPSKAQPQQGIPTSHGEKKPAQGAPASGQTSSSQSKAPQAPPGVPAGPGQATPAWPVATPYGYMDASHHRQLMASNPEYRSQHERFVQEHSRRQQEALQQQSKAGQGSKVGQQEQPSPASGVKPNPSRPGVPQQHSPQVSSSGVVQGFRQTSGPSRQTGQHPGDQASGKTHGQPGNNPTATQPQLSPQQQQPLPLVQGSKPGAASHSKASTSLSSAASVAKPGQQTGPHPQVAMATGGPQIGPLPGHHHHPGKPGQGIGEGDTEKNVLAPLHPGNKHHPLGDTTPRPVSSTGKPDDASRKDKTAAAASESQRPDSGGNQPSKPPPGLISDREKEEQRKRERERADQTLREKQSENRQILKENLEIKEQMENRARYEALSNRQREELQRYYMFQQQKYIEQQQRYGLGQSSDSHSKPSASEASSRSSTPIMSPREKDGHTSRDPSLQARQSRKPEAPQFQHDSPRSSSKLREEESRPRSVDRGMDRSSSSSPHPSNKSTSKDPHGPPSGKDPHSLPPGKDPHGLPLGKDPHGLPPGKDPHGLPPGGLPPPFSQYYSHPFLQAPHMAGQMPFDPSHPMVYPAVMGYPGPAYIHPSQIRYGMPSPGDGPGSLDKPMILSPGAPRPPEGKALDLLQQHAAQYYGPNNNHGPHKIHELKDVGKHGDRDPRPSSCSPTPKDLAKERPESRNAALSKEKELHRNSPPTQRHLHTHHHTHVVEAAYPLYGSYGGPGSVMSGGKSAASSSATSGNPALPAPKPTSGVFQTPPK